MCLGGPDVKFFSFFESICNVVSKCVCSTNFVDEELSDNCKVTTLADTADGVDVVLQTLSCLLGREIPALVLGLVSESLSSVSATIVVSPSTTLDIASRSSISNHFEVG